jgi:GxxExxY protein
VRDSPGIAGELNQLTERILGAAISVHREIGPGMLEAAYEACLAYELEQDGLLVERQKPLPLTYRGVTLDCGYRVDFLVDERVIVEVKSVEKIRHVHKAQLLSYVRMFGCQVGLLLNFNAEVLKDGIHRVVNGLPEEGRR